MSFKYNGSVVNLGNYLSIFKNLEVDMLDEIRSAILDDTPIAGYIKYCGSDSYKLGQLRMAVREYVPKEFINPRLSGKCIYYLRQLYCCDISLKPFERYIPKNGNPTIECSSLEIVLKAVLNGADIRRVNFNTVPTENIELICEGLIKGYPMWLYTSADVNLPNSVIKQLMKGMQLGVDIHPFLDGTWSESQIVAVLSNTTRFDVNLLLEHINSKFSIAQIMEVVYVARKKLDFTLLCKKDEDGNPVFNEYQMNVIGLCMEDEVLTKEIYNPMLSDMEMNDLRVKELEKIDKEKRRKLSGTLR